MSEMVERVAVAIGKHFHDPKSKPNDAALAALFDLAARAAIEAMREPTDAMVAAADDSQATTYDGSVRSAWSAAIDAALR